MPLNTPELSLFDGPRPPRARPVSSPRTLSSSGRFQKRNNSCKHVCFLSRNPVFSGISPAASGGNVSATRVAGKGTYQLPVCLGGTRRRRFEGSEEPACQRATVHPDSGGGDVCDRQFPPAEQLSPPR